LLGQFMRDAGLLTGKLVTTFHGADVSAAVRRYGDNVYARLFEAGDLFLPISQHWKNRLIELGCPADKIVVHRMGIDCDAFSFVARRPRGDGTVRFISVCRLVEKKGIEYAIRAIAALAGTGRKVAYDVVGDGPERARLEHLAAEAAVNGLVKFHGWQKRDEVMALLATANAFVAPSVTASSGEQEGIPVALMEAMAMGLPVVSTRHSGIPELIDEGVSGLLVQERDTDDLEKALGYLLENTEVWASMGHAGRAKVERHFSIGRLNDRLVGLFENLIEDNAERKRGIGDDYKAQEVS
jgi:colanic acid/amylovoran biosynthesis glycosyltransferase